MNPLKILKYGKYFSESRFLAFATRYGKKLAFVQRGVVLFLCLRDSDTPKYVKAVIAGALGYLILPADVVPDAVAALGWLDDVAVLGLAFKVANRYIKTEHEENAKKLFPFGH
ncbi:YkvA family protein [Veillonella agrestimuris]|uniref:YkvA family protein n=1 Tax=Veillonella agrestimuris TaxID=2941340 RepID=UPI002041BB25|nr:YkvA family protein [Veillonella agrestimuris]